MALKVFSAKNYNEKLKATIQVTGRLGFTQKTAEVLNLANRKHIKIARDDQESGNMYLIICVEKDEDAFLVHKSGEYFFINTSLLFSDLNYDYKRNTIIFDLSRRIEYDKEMGGEVYKMNRRDRIKKVKKRNCE